MGSARLATIVIGVSLLALAAGCIAGGVIARSKFDMYNVVHPPEATVGLWGSYFSITGLVFLLVGCFDVTISSRFAIVAHILGMLLALAGMTYAALIWTGLNSPCLDRIAIGPFVVPLIHSCACSLAYHKTFIYDINCSDVETVRDANAAITIVYAFLFFVSCVGMVLSWIKGKNNR